MPKASRCIIAYARKASPPPPAVTTFCVTVRDATGEKHVFLYERREMSVKAYLASQGITDELLWKAEIVFSAAKRDSLVEQGVSTQLWVAV